MAPGTRSKFGTPVFTPAAFPKQMYCIEESICDTCDIVGTFARLAQWSGVRGIVAPLFPLFAPLPLRTACLAMYQTTMKTISRRLQRACQPRRLSNVVAVRPPRSEICWYGPHWSSCRKPKTNYLPSNWDERESYGVDQIEELLGLARRGRNWQSAKLLAMFVELMATTALKDCKDSASLRLVHRMQRPFLTHKTFGNTQHCSRVKLRLRSLCLQCCQREACHSTGGWKSPNLFPLLWIFISIKHWLVLPMPKFNQPRRSGWEGKNGGLHRSAAQRTCTI